MSQALKKEIFKAWLRSKFYSEFYSLLDFLRSRLFLPLSRCNLQTFGLFCSIFSPTLTSHSISVPLFRPLSFFLFLARLSRRETAVCFPRSNSKEGGAQVLKPCTRTRCAVMRARFYTYTRACIYVQYTAMACTAGTLVGMTKEAFACPDPG